MVGGVDWNKSPPASFQTTNRGGVAYAQPVLVDEELRLRGGNYRYTSPVIILFLPLASVLDYFF